MTNSLAVFLGFVIVAALVGDAIFNDWQAALFMMRKFVELTEYLAFWR